MLDFSDLVTFHSGQVKFLFTCPGASTKKVKLSHDVTSGSEITPCNKIDNLVVYRFSASVMTSITTLRI